MILDLPDLFSALVLAASHTWRWSVSVNKLSVSFRVDYFFKCSITKKGRPNFLLIQGLYISYIR